MEDTIRCPMCSKPNPADRDVCQYCQARLKPMTGPRQDTPVNQSSGDLPNWLDSFREEDELDDQEDENAPIEPPETNVPDWLSRIREKSQMEEVARAANSPDVPELPDWLKDDTDESSLTQNPAEESRLDWMDLRQDSSHEQHEEDVTIDAWLENLRDDPLAQRTTSSPGEGADPKDMGQALDWWEEESAAIQPEGGEMGSSLIDRVGVYSTEDIDPLANWSPGSFTGETGTGQLPELEETDDEEEESQALPADEFPDWLSDLPEPPLQPEPTPHQTGNFNWPVFGSQANQPPAFEGTQVFPEPASELPEEPAADTSDWLNDFSAPPPVEAQKTPNWLSSLDQPHQTHEAFEDIPTQRIRSIRPQPVEDTGESPPDWLASLGTGADFPPPSSTPFLEDAPVVPMNNLPADPFVMSALPDWLSALGPAGRRTGEEGSVSSSEPMEFEGGELTPAELPSWVKAMRPIESVTSDAGAVQENDQRVERSGPLAGIRGVLPVEPSVTEYRKPPLYSIKLQTTDSQTRYSEILEELLSNETAPIQPRSERLISSQRILRILIGLALIAAIAAGSLFPIFSAPAQPGANLVNFKSSIDGVTAGSPVLLILDYEPALAGEMEAAAAGVIQQLASQGVPLAFTSTLPTGPAMTVHLLESLSGSAMVAQTQTIQLGYLAGGPAGIYNFLNYPTATAPLWDSSSPILQGVVDLSGFQRVILITDSQETGQNWFEQWAAAEVTRPNLGQVPLLLISSAQAAPILRTYQESGQIDGIISGIQDGAAYETQLQQPALAVEKWNGYVFGLVVAFLVILLGGLVNLVIARLPHRASKDEG